MMNAAAQEVLKKYFGYDSFRPLQEDIISDILAQKDVFVLMPTGGGKSLCYQLPSIMQQGTTIVVSPLISLMKDQVDALRANGIQAAFLNSSLTINEQNEIIHLLQNNQLKLLYVAPERLVQDSFLQLLKSLDVNFFAIDEAHCISQWGHDFRPEYRQLRLLRSHFPKKPVVALTATATERVKQDILEQLSLTPRIYQASFNRPNLMYYIYPKQNAFLMTLAYIKKHAGESGIVYCQSRKTVDRLADKLQEEGVKALPYHAGLTDDERKKNQEQFIKENIDLIVATIAFGMGIDKPNVRYVIHYDLPKSLEHYYQETGRAGRDNLPSDCIFLFSIGDMFFYERFNNEKDLAERQIAKQQLQTVISYAQSKLCRRLQLLNYFNEKYAEKNCGACDNCLTPRETFDGTILAQKILSCVHRVSSRFGASHIANILTGSKTKAVLERKHDLLSTYNIVQNYSARDLKLFIYELVQQGYLLQSDDQYGILSLMSKSTAVLKGKETVWLTKIEEHIPTDASLEQDTKIEKEFFEILRALRKKIADKANVPPYVIFADVSLKEMATYFPQNEDEFSKVYGVGEEKLKKFGAQFIKEIQAYCIPRGIKSSNNTPIRKAKTKKKPTKSDSVLETLRLFREGKPLQQIAIERGYTESTIARHLQIAYLKGEQIDIDLFVPRTKQKKILQAFQELGMQYLAPVKEKLSEDYTYDELRWVQAKLIKEGETP